MTTESSPALKKVELAEQKEQEFQRYTHAESQSGVELTDTGGEFRTRLNDVPLGVMVVDRDYRIRAMNEAMRRHFNVGEGAVLGEKCHRIIKGIQTVCSDCPGLQAMSEGRPVMIQKEEFSTKSCSKHIRLQALPTFDPKRKISGFSLLSEDVSEAHDLARELALGEERLRTIFKTGGAAIAMASPGGRFLEANPAYCNFLGYSEEELKKLTVMDVTHPADQERTRQVVDETLARKGMAYRMEKRYLRRDGAVVWGQATVTWAHDRQGRPVYSIGTVQDITEQKQAMEDLRFRKAFESLMAQISTRFLKGRSEDFSANIDRTLQKIGRLFGAQYCYLICEDQDSTELNLAHGWSATDLRTFTECVGDFAACRPWVWRRIRNGDVVEIDDAADLPEEASMDRIHLEGYAIRSLMAVPVQGRGRVSGVLGLDYSVQEEASPLLNIRMLRTLAEVIGNALQRYESDRILQDLAATLEQRVAERTEELRRTNASLQLEIEERRRTEEQLRKMQRAVESNPDIVVITDAEGEIEYVNPKFCEITGFIRDEVIGTDIVSLTAQPQEQLEKMLAELRSGHEWRGNYLNRKQDGEHYWESASISPIRDTAGGITHFVRVGRDITESRKKDDRINQLSRAVEQSPASIVITDPQGIVQFVNPRFTDVSGFSPEEVLGSDVHKVLCRNASAQDATNIFNKLLTGGEWRGEMQHCRKDGTPYWVYASLSAIRNEQGEVTHLLSVQEDITERKRLETVLRDEKQLLEEKQRELEQAYTDLQASQFRILQQEKMASIGQLAAGVAHEINNPMGFITSNLGTLKKYADRLLQFIEAQNKALEVPTPCDETFSKLDSLRRSLKIDYILDDLDGVVDESLDGAQRVKQIVQDLKSFSRSDGAQLELVDLHYCLDSSINMAWNEIKYKAELERDYGDLPPIMGYPHQLGQVFLNLLVNAAHAIEDHGKIRVETREENKYLRISICDDGCGIVPEKMDKIFEPFYTTKPEGRGTGLGLSISYEIVKKHGGDIFVASEPGEGTTFTLRLPYEREDVQ